MFDVTVTVNFADGMEIEVSGTISSLDQATTDLTSLLEGNGIKPDSWSSLVVVIVPRKAAS